MTDKSDTSRELLETALRTYRAEMAPQLSGSKRYVGAMVANAVEVAIRALEADDPADQLAGLGDGARDLAALAAAIRSGEIGDKTHPGLREALRAYVRAKLEISNPKFLRSRES